MGSAAAGQTLRTEQRRKPLEIQIEVAPSLAEDPRWLLVKRIVASPHFSRSRLLSRFLRYIVVESLEGRAEQITEHAIGVGVFERSASYRTVEDNIVRNYARQLRRRLVEYERKEGVEDLLRLSIPLGGYIPVFVDIAERIENCSADFSALPVVSEHLVPLLAPVSDSAQKAIRSSVSARWQKAIFFLAFLLYSFFLIALTACAMWWWATRHKP